MIEIVDKSHCCGCSACVSSCPKECIEMLVDGEGFPYPHVDTSRCVGCGRCDSVCPFVNPPDGAPHISACGAKSFDDSLRKKSSSGGLFSELARPVLSSGGIVYGVAMDAGCQSCSFVRADTWDALNPMRGSKYLQADARGVYERVEDDLREGRRVLFSGTPCQVNALANLLGERRDNVLLVDCVCHGVPSPKLWSESVNSLKDEVGIIVDSVNFRCKERGWRRYGLEETGDGGRFFQTRDTSQYLRMFLRNVCLRPSCYECRAKVNRASDITIADFWGVDYVLPEMSDDLGVSLVIARTQAGADAMQAISPSIEWREVDYDDAVARNRSEFSSVLRPSERDAFFRDLDTLGYGGVAQKYGAVNPKQQAKRLIKGALSQTGLLSIARKLKRGRTR